MTIDVGHFPSDPPLSQQPWYYPSASEDGQKLQVTIAKDTGSSGRCNSGLGCQVQVKVAAWIENRLKEGTEFEDDLRVPAEGFINVLPIPDFPREIRRELTSCALALNTVSRDPRPGCDPPRCVLFIVVRLRERRHQTAADGY